jgi:hypothetical protein
MILVSLLLGLMVGMNEYVFNEYIPIAHYPVSNDPKRFITWTFFFILLPGGLYLYNEYFAEAKKSFDKLYCIYITVLTLYLSADSIFHLINAKLDNAPPEIISATLVSKYSDTSRDPSHYLIIKSNSDKNLYAFMVPDFTLFHTSKKGQTIILQVKPGYLGSKWIQKYERK